MAVRVVCSGPIFDGRYRAIVRDFCSDAPEVMAHVALVEVQTNLNASIRRPTPYYETQVNMHPLNSGFQVDDRGVIYGHWLEGTGSRNATTRFKGYFSFRRAKNYIELHASRILERDVRRMIARLNG